MQKTLEAGAGIYRSGDGGQTFQLVLQGQASDIVEDPLTQTTFYAALPGNNLFISTDSGQSWNSFLVSPSSLPITTSGDLRLGVGTDLVAGQTILWAVVMDSSGHPQVVLRSPINSYRRSHRRPSPTISRILQQSSRSPGRRGDISSTRTR